MEEEKEGLDLSGGEGVDEGEGEGGEGGEQEDGDQQDKGAKLKGKAKAGLLLVESVNRFGCK